MSKVLHLSVHAPPYGVQRVCDRCGAEIDCTEIYTDEEDMYDNLEEYAGDFDDDVIRCTDEET